MYLKNGFARSFLHRETFVKNRNSPWIRTQWIEFLNVSQGLRWAHRWKFKTRGIAPLNSNQSWSFIPSLSLSLSLLQCLNYIQSFSFFVYFTPSLLIPLCNLCTVCCIIFFSFSVSCPCFFFISFSANCLRFSFIFRLLSL